MKIKIKGLLFVLCLLTLSIILGACNAFLYCGNNRCTAWSYISHYSDRNGVSILALRDYSILTEDNVLHIPTHINGRPVLGFGNSLLWADTVYFNPGTQTEKIVMPDGVRTEGNFWSELMPLVVEFLATDPTVLSFTTVRDDAVRTIIVPDGTLSLYRERLGISRGFRLVERSAWAN